MNWRLKLKILLTLNRRIRDTRGTAAPVTWKGFIQQFLLGNNKTAYWPVHSSSTVTGSPYILTGKGTAPGLAHGCYIFADMDSPVIIGDYTIVAPNTGIAAYNHNMFDYRKYDKAGPLTIGKYCWLGMNSVILPGVKLGDHTIVAAGAVVTKSFPDGYVVIGGNPARVLKEVDKANCNEYRNDKEYIGYLTVEEFQKNRISLINSGI